MKPASRRISAAFSLVELLVAISITGLLLLLMSQMLGSTQLAWKNIR